jgi:hypothetical protein
LTGGYHLAFAAAAGLAVFIVRPGVYQFNDDGANYWVTVS